MEKIPGIIVDYSSREQSEEELAKEIEKSSVICLVYSMTDHISKEKLVSYWLPKIHEIEDSACSVSPSTSFNSSLSENVNSLSASTPSRTPTKRPIIIVANKCDQDNCNITSDSLVAQLVISNSQIDTCVQCSAKTLKNVPEVFYYAQKSILYPTSPIYDVDKKQLTQQAVKCLTRIFKLCDHDNDGRLSDKELNEFQLKCFGVRLNSPSLQEVKSLLNIGDSINGDKNENLVNNEITLKGFLYLHTLFIKKGRHETCWTVFKKFGYDKNLSISRDYATIK